MLREISYNIYISCCYVKITAVINRLSGTCGRIIIAAGVTKRHVDFVAEMSMVFPRYGMEKNELVAQKK